MAEQLTLAAAEVLAFEREWTGRIRDGRYDGAIIARFGEQPARYSQRLLAIIDDPAAVAYDPELVNRLRLLREQRHAERARGRQVLAGAR